LRDVESDEFTHHTPKRPSQTISNPKNAINGTSHTAGLEKQMKQRWTKLLLAEHLEKLQDEAKY
jgi:hypothetical protein